MSGLWTTKSAGRWFDGKFAGKRFVRDWKAEERFKQFCRENELEDIAEQIQAVYVEAEVDADGS